MTPEGTTLVRLPTIQQDEFQHVLADRYSSVPAYLKSESLWSPVTHSVERYDELVIAQRALQTGLKALHATLPEDERLQSLLWPRLEPDVRKQYGVIESIPLATQFIRPDYILDKDGNPQICEINTRFMFNGNIASVHMAEFLKTRFDINIEPYERMDGFMHGTYDGPGRTVIVRGREPYHDLLLQTQRSESPRIVHPELLDILQAKKIGRVILELHQHELAGAIGNITRLMLKGVTVYNDPRTVAFLHDKRLMVALSDTHYMERLVGTKKAELLARYIIPSYHPSWEGREPETMPGKMALVKRAIAGKSQGMRMVRLADYRNRLEQPESYVYQSRIRQTAYATQLGPAEIAGTLPMTLEDEVFGPGIVRILAHNRLRGFYGFSIAVKASK